MLDDQLLSVAVPRPLDNLYTYRLPGRLAAQVKVGAWVKVPFGKKVTHAYVVEPPKQLSELPTGLDPSKLKDIIEVGAEDTLLPDDVMKLCRWTQDYYQAPIGEVLNVAAPSVALGLKSKKKLVERTAEEKAETLLAFSSLKFDLTEEQKIALQEMEKIRLDKASKQTRVTLLEGVTGSGKTELYIELARQSLKEGKGVLILVPEIALTPQLHARFENSLGVKVGLWHSALADGRRREIWSRLRSGDLKILIGARSAVFAPITNLDLIIVDEEHDSSYKQEDRVRYQARDLAVVRAKMSGAYAVLGSATPSLESRKNILEGRYHHSTLKKRVMGGGLPEIDIVNMTEEERLEGCQAVLATRTLAEIQSTIQKGNQVMIYLNRRGFASFLLCEDCGEVEGCPHCSVSMTVHKKRKKLTCHQCGTQSNIPSICQKCQSDRLSPMGAGTESLEEELPPLVEGLIPIRLDRDKVTSAGRLEKILNDFREGKANALLGTQMLVKGHDFPKVTLVVVIMADTLFRFPDFRSHERAYQILTQVSGRAGRGELAGKVLIQTFSVENPVIATIAGQRSEASFIQEEQELRSVLQYPPYGRLARLRFEDKTSAKAAANARQVAQSLKAHLKDSKFEILGPSEAFLEKLKGSYRWDLLIRSQSIQALQKAVVTARSMCKKQKWPLIIDVDPSGLG